MTTRLAVFLALALSASPVLRSQSIDAETIIRKSTAANAADFKAISHYSYKERDVVGHGTKTYQVEMADGSPYNRLIAVNGKPLSAEAQATETKKEREEKSKRRAENEDDRRNRIAKYEKDLKRDQNMLDQLTQAFTFQVAGTEKLRGFRVYRLKATPRPAYQPPNMDCQILPAMQGQLWIDQKTFQWVRVTAQVMRPASIEGFLAQVEPGTRFELDKAPVGKGVWMPSHFAMRSRAKVLFLVNHSSSDDETYFDYVPAEPQPGPD